MRSIHELDADLSTSQTMRCRREPSASIMLLSAARNYFLGTGADYAIANKTQCKRTEPLTTSFSTMPSQVAGLSHWNFAADE